MASERVIRDPIHNLIHLRDSELDRLLTRLIDCAEFQRLRRIRQLGFSELVFPGATHTRFAHSLGVMHIAKRMLNRLRQLGLDFDDGIEAVVLCGALLHDVGHGPFSHAFEKITQSHHERYTRQIIEDDSTQVHQCLKDFEPTLPERISAFFDENPNDDGAASVPAYMVRVITSQFDADRADYLLRDSLATGTLKLPPFFGQVLSKDSPVCIGGSAPRTMSVEESRLWVRSERTTRRNSRPRSRWRP